MFGAKQKRTSLRVHFTPHVGHARAEKMSKQEDSENKAKAADSNSPDDKLDGTKKKPWRDRLGVLNLFVRQH